MKREEFMKYAEREIDNAFRGQRNRMMNLVEQAWAEGKRNAEIDGVASIVKGVMEKLSEEKEQGAEDEQKFDDLENNPTVGVKLNWDGSWSEVREKDKWYTDPITKAGDAE